MSVVGDHKSWIEDSTAVDVRINEPLRFIPIDLTLNLLNIEPCVCINIADTFSNGIDRLSEIFGDDGERFRGCAPIATTPIGPSESIVIIARSFAVCAQETLDEIMLLGDIS